MNFVTMLVLRAQGGAALGVSPEMAERVRAAESAYWATPWYMPIVAGSERLFAIAIQIALAQLVMRSFTRGNPLYLGAAVGFHVVVDAWAVWAMGTWGIAAAEGGVAVLAGCALWLIWRLRSAETLDAGSPTADRPPALTAADLAPAVLSPAELARRAERARYE